MYLNIISHTPVGTFVGSASRTSSSAEDLQQLRDALQSSSVYYLVLFVGDTEVLIPGDVFKVSVTEFNIQDKPVKG